VETMAVFINFGAMILNSIADGSGIFFGENVQQGWSSPDKVNTASSVSGFGDLICSQVNIINDSDLIDHQPNIINTNTPFAPQILKGI
jgi:hypothetical protein